MALLYYEYEAKVVVQKSKANNQKRSKQDVVNSYNNSVRQTLGRKLIDITSAVVGDMREEMFSNRPPSKKKGDIKIDDTVRYCPKGYLLNWTQEIFTVAAINRKASPVTYKLND